ncbi:hypothetical protein DFJ65_2385 [Calidifontibacter indicus]|uniref:Uncharacterized protein n=2 Tax=Calidifontibacter indicus TaxID=419650 RepID=A0A3D9UPS8_9MICO|nr:hypothetical protein DFJ65_2385 [Calidifontibacter indicus]
MVELLGRYSSLAFHRPLLDHAKATATRPARDGATEPAVAWRVTRRLPDATRQAIIDAYQQGDSAKALADRYGIARNTVLALVSEAGVPRKLRRMNADETAVVHRLREQGMSVRAICAHVGFKETAVRDALKRSTA